MECSECQAVLAWSVVTVMMAQEARDLCLPVIGKTNQKVKCNFLGYLLMQQLEEKYLLTVSNY